MNKLEKRGEQIARLQQQIAIGRIAARLKEELHAIHVETGASEIRINGAGLFRRWLTESGLRFVSGLVK